MTEHTTLPVVIQRVCVPRKPTDGGGSLVWQETGPTNVKTNKEHSSADTPVSHRIWANDSKKIRKIDVVGILFQADFLLLIYSFLSCFRIGPRTSGIPYLAQFGVSRRDLGHGQHV